MSMPHQFQHTASAAPRLSRVPSFRLLTGFEAAARLGSYARAAEELAVTPSAISHQIAELESQLDQALFRRKGRGIELTVAGRVLHESVVRSLDLIRRGLGRIGSYFDEGLVALVCPAPLAQGWLQPRLQGLIDAQPGLCPVVSIDESARYIDELDVDIAILRQPIEQPDVTAQPLLRDERWVVGLPVFTSSSNGPPPALMCLEGDMNDSTTGDWLRQNLGRHQRTTIYDDERLLLDAALRGRGLAMVSRWLADEALADGRLAPWPGCPPLAAGTFWIHCRAGTPRSPRISQLYADLLSLAAQ